MKGKSLHLCLLFLLLFYVFGLMACASWQKKEPSPGAFPLQQATPAPTPTPEPTVIAQKVEWGAFLPLLQHETDTDVQAFMQALQQSLAWCRTRSSQEELKFASLGFTVGELQKSLELLSSEVQKTQKVSALAEILPNLFDVYTVAQDEGSVLVTGYYLPSVEASRTPTSEFSVPIYGVPPDLVTVYLGDFLSDLKGKVIRGRVEKQKLVPYWDRNAIRTQNVLAKAPVLGWVKSEWDAFVIEVQGSGVLRFNDGSEQVISYAEQNGHKYNAVGSLLLKEGKIQREKLSMQAIGAYLRDNPHEVRRVLDYNPSFVFFRFVPNYAEGSLGFPITPMRSVATDHKIYPPAVMMFLMFERPKLLENGTVGSDGWVARFVLNQDRGGAIRGAKRVDFFWGHTEEASRMAGMTRHSGRLFVFVPKKAQTLALGSLSSP